MSWEMRLLACTHAVARGGVLLYCLVLALSFWFALGCLVQQASSTVLQVAFLSKQNSDPSHHLRHNYTISPRGNGASLQGAAGAMRLLAWNCRGSGGGLCSPTMNHLVRICVSTKAKLIFISETRKQKVNSKNLKSKLCFDHAHIVPSIGLSGGLWLLWKDEFDLKVIISSPNYILDKSVHQPSATSFTLVCIYGDPHHSRTDVIWQDVLNFIENYPQQTCFDCGLFDLGYHGPAFTWSNKRFASMPTYERLDRCLANTDWINAFPNTSVHHLPMLYSDHCPILIKMDSLVQKFKKPFRFENRWLQEADFQQVAKDSWSRSRRRDFNLKTTYLAADLKTWRRKKPNISDQITTIENQLSVLQAQTPTLHNHRSQQMLIQQHHDVMQKNEEYHKQRAKKQWAALGDRNTNFFHKCILKRARKNKIPFILTHDGHTLTTNEHMTDYFRGYFTNLFTSQLNGLPLQEMEFKEGQGPDTLHDAFTESIPTAIEIWNTVKAMRNDAAPGPDGLNAAFYKAAWPWIARDVVDLVTKFYQTAQLPQELNKTFITLIPKAPINVQRAVTPQAMQILNKAWQDANLQPKLKTFLWRLLRYFHSRLRNVSERKISGPQLQAENPGTCTKLQLTSATIHSDNQEVVTALNDPYPISKSSHWRLRPVIATIVNNHKI
ncbi:hypothetical protein U9M48_027564 [Paspalum notatum var. saurae]|uniref:Endonuclease/exonuclease/phosphatase domain-containing protein n=1 Tax=Paspalum notatum var. saurae TaxID=547442 RepID=A0AAQ3WZJ8_PASNO